jgi:hypothetical protein
MEKYLYKPSQAFADKLDDIKKTDPKAYTRIQQVIDRLLVNPGDADGKMHGRYQGEEPRQRVGASSKEKARLDWGHSTHNRAIHLRAQLTCNSTRTCFSRRTRNGRRHYLAFSRKLKKYVGRKDYRLIYYWCELCRKENRRLESACEHCKSLPDQSVIFFDLYHKKDSKRV